MKVASGIEHGSDELHQALGIGGEYATDGGLDRLRNDRHQQRRAQNVEILRLLRRSAAAS